MLKILELTEKDLIERSEAFQCVLDCMNIAGKESCDLVISTGKHGDDWVYTPEQVIKLGLEDGSKFLVAIEDGVYKGGIHYSIGWEDTFKPLYLHQIAVKPEYRRQGVGHALLKYLISKEGPNVDEIQVGLVSNNIVARKLYESVGFRVYSMWMVKPSE